LTVERVVVLHTNDLHSHFENIPKIRRYLRHTRKKLEQEQVTVITVDLGDAMDRVHPYTEATDGKINIKLMNQIGYDAVTIGNNEGIGNSHQQLTDLYTQANFPVVVDNLLDRTTGKPPKWTCQSKIIVTQAGTKIGLLGCTAPFAATYDMNDWQALAVDQVLPQQVQALAAKTDYIILLSHLGINWDRKIAHEYPQIDLILGSHTHHLLETGEQVGQALLCAAGKWGQYVGQATLTFDKHQLKSAQAKVIKTEDLPEQVGDQVEIANYQQMGEKLLQRFKVANLPTELNAAWQSTSPLMQATLAAIEQLTGTDLAILNGGLFLGDLHQGIVTRNDLHRILPHPMRVVKVRLNGYNLWRLIREMEKNRNHLRNAIVKGNGFRGKIFGELVYAGIKFDSADKMVMINNHPINLSADYEIATVDNFIYCPYFPTLEIAGHAKYWGDRFLRDILGDYLADLYPIRKEQGVE
jgi:2',3'-cyclic-nucleotide 2'-phosphodiesterase (5'-nucleotidase family)